VAAPDLAVVMMDGGRLQIFDRSKGGPPVRRRLAGLRGMDRGIVVGKGRLRHRGLGRAAGYAGRTGTVGWGDESADEVVGVLGYLRNQRGRMKYAEYRRAGLPITTSHVESTIKRVKGTEKFWFEPGAEAILQLRADSLSDTNPLDEFWIRRAKEMTGERRQRSRSDTNTLAV